MKKIIYLYLFLSFTIINKSLTTDHYVRNGASGNGTWTNDCENIRIDGKNDTDNIFDDIRVDDENIGDY